jgi:ubiquinone/menaquinone biosynthesis C-methylase UbiE
MLTNDNQVSVLAEQQRLHHASAFRQRLEDGSVSIWLDPDNGDYWGNSLVLESLVAPLSILEPRTVLTLGDGKGGKEAVFFRNCGHSATATDICDDVLAEAYRLGLIEAYASADAENLAFDDAAFEIVATKETLHHLPRPYLALHEMLRVAKEGVILIEPHYRLPDPERVGIIGCLRRAIMRLSGHRSPPFMPPAEYEESGNFVFRFNPYELTQIARSMGMAAVAFAFAHHYFEPGCATITGDELRRLKDAKRTEFAAADRRNGVESRPMLIALLWKRTFTVDFASALTTAGFNIYLLDRP